MKKNENAEIELNLFYMHFRDAEIFLELAKKEISKLKSLYARHSILSTVFAGEALINRVYGEFYIGGMDVNTIIRKLSTTEKWLLAPFLCGKENPPGKTFDKGFDKGKDPFQSFKELITIRHFLVHPKPGKFVKAKREGDISWEEMKGEEFLTGPTVPVFEISKGVSYWPHTRIPQNPFEMNEKHAEQALKTLEEMIDILLDIFKGIFDKEWTMKMAYRLQDDESKSSMHIKWLWGGLTPADNSIHSSKIKEVSDE